MTLPQTANSLTDLQRSDLVELAKKSNEDLLAAGAEGAEQSFGLGFVLGALPLAAAIVVLYLSGIFNIILSFITLIMGIIAVTGIASLVASFARTRRIDLTYRESVNPGIDAYLGSHSLTRTQFEAVAVDTLPVGAPLRSFLPPVDPEGGSPVKA